MFSFNYKGFLQIKKLNIVIIFILLLSFCSCGISKNAILPQCSNQAFVREFSRLTFSQVDSLKNIYGKNKIFIDQFIEPSLIALSYYPELKNIYIEFKYSKENTTMAARPVSMSLFSNPRYVVLINNEKNFKEILLKDVPFNAQIGVIGHELAHVADYHNHNIWGVMGILFRFLDKERKILFEKEIDRATIERGLGWQLYDWAMYSMYTNKSASAKYKRFKRNTYMQPDEIKRLINFFSKYAQTSNFTPNLQR